MSNEYSFDNFIPGNDNRFAYYVVRCVALNPGTVYNPLFIYGPSGVGKTHLLGAVKTFLDHDSSCRVTYIKSSEFADALVDAIRTMGIREYRESFRSVDVLLLDDLQKMAGKECTAETFELIFDEMIKCDKQVIIAADRLPEDIFEKNNNLVRRLHSSLMVDLKEPDKASRKAIANAEAAKMNADFSDDISQLVAEVTNNGFQIQGIVRKLVCWKNMTGQELTLDTASGILEEAMLGKQFEPEDILDAVCAVFGVTEESLVGNAKTKDIGKARKTAAYVLRKHSQQSVFDIAEMMKRDFNTVFQWIQYIGREISRGNFEWENRIRTIEAELNDNYR